MESLGVKATATVEATLRFLSALDPPLSEDVLDALRKIVSAQGLSMDVLRALGHDGLIDVGVSRCVDRARILASSGLDVPIKRKVENTGKKLREFEVSRVSFFQLKGIDPVAQCFDAHVYFEFIVRGAAHDLDLMEPGEDFSYPYPPLAWYWNHQVDFPNAVAHEVKECKIIPGPKVNNQPSPDMVCIIRVDGTFSERLELHKFPIDQQDLTVSLEIKCAQEGPTPVRIIVPEGVKAGIDKERFDMNNIWDLSENVVLKAEESGLKLNGGVREKTYISLHASASVCRLTSFYFANIVTPMSFFAALTVFCSFCVPRDDVGDRLSVSLTLMLTAAAYKLAITTMMPTIAYLTLLDKYLLSTSGIIVLVVIQNGVAKINSRSDADTDELSGFTFDRISLYVICGLWAAVHAYFMMATFVTFEARRLIDVNRAGHQRRANHRLSSEFGVHLITELSKRV